MAKKRKKQHECFLNGLCEILSGYCGERGDNEGAIETLIRIISERDELIKRVVNEAVGRK